MTELTSLMSTRFGVTLHGLMVVLALLAYVVATHVLHQRRHPTAAIAWVFFILLLPYLALPTFLVFGSRKQPRPLLLPSPEASPPDAPWSIRTIAALAQPAPSAYRDLVIHADGREAAARLAHVIDDATESIDACTFIVGDDGIGRDVVERLAAKARSGVTVRVMVDGMGKLMHSHPDTKALVDAGARMAVFVPPLRLPIRARANLRDHRKLVVADAGRDARRVWSGGRNFADEYFAGRRGEAPWRDLTFDVGGDVVLQASELFERDWAYANGEREIGRGPGGEPRRPSPPLVAPRPERCAQLVASGPDEVDDTVWTMLVTGAYQAKSRIALATPYFVPDSALLAALSMAARRGVAVDVLIPARSNHPMSDVARRRALRALATAGGRVWLAPGMLHAKLAIVDDDLALCGSANVDSRSLFLNYELMFAFHDRGDVARFAAWYDRERAGAARYEAKAPGLVADVAEGLVLWTGFQL